MSPSTSGKRQANENERPEVKDMRIDDHKITNEDFPKIAKDNKVIPDPIDDRKFQQ